jgi:RimJ/RimL family protein N-acetyltransferase
LDVYSYNPRAIKVYKRLGFKIEGKNREHAFWQDKFYDAYYMGILDREWKKIKK